MSAFSIAFGTIHGTASLAICEGAIAGQRVSAVGACAPVWVSSIPASAPCS
jgi:hypothetical protein